MLRSNTESLRSRSPPRRKVNAASYAQPQGRYSFTGNEPRRRSFDDRRIYPGLVRLARALFLLFQVVYPPTIALLPPPARVSVIAPNLDRRRAPSCAGSKRKIRRSLRTTQRPAEARPYQLPKIAARAFVYRGAAAVERSSPTRTGAARIQARIRPVRSHGRNRRPLPRRWSPDDDHFFWLVRRSPLHPAGD